jgi:pantoate--beta-alanine ligase
MKQTAAQLRAGAEISAALAAGSGMIGAAGFALDYFELRHAETLAPVTSVRDGPLRILVAAKLGNTRLIDNFPV